MNANEIESAVVIGAGTMGHGIAQVLAMSGVSTQIVDIDEAVLERAMGAVRANLAKGVEKGKVTAEAQSAALERLTTSTDLAGAAAGAHVVIEAVPEKMELKKSIFSTLSGATDAGTLLATNTSSLPVSEIASATAHPERVVGMHFFNPVHIMKLVEVVRGNASDDASVELALGLARRMGKDPITVTDSPGFASSRLGLVIGLEAIRMLESGVASAEDIDKAMTLGYGFPMGPLKLTDLVGLDVRLSIAEYLAGEVGAHFEPPALLREKVERGELGKKSGQGFYAW